MVALVVLFSSLMVGLVLFFAKTKSNIKMCLLMFHCSYIGLCAGIISLKEKSNEDEQDEITVEKDGRTR